MVMNWKEIVLLAWILVCFVIIAVNVVLITRRRLRYSRAEREGREKQERDRQWYLDLQEGDRLRWVANPDFPIYEVRCRDNGEPYIAGNYKLFPVHRVYFTKLERSGPW